MEILIPFVQEMVGKYDREKIEQLCVNLWGYCGIFEMVCQTFINSKAIPPIESLPEDHKRRLWNRTNKSDTREKRIQQAKALYLIEQLYDHIDGDNLRERAEQEQLLPDS